MEETIGRRHTFTERSNLDIDASRLVKLVLRSGAKEVVDVEIFVLLNALEGERKEVFIPLALGASSS